MVTKNVRMEAINKRKFITVLYDKFLLPSIREILSDIPELSKLLNAKFTTRYFMLYLNSRMPGMPDYPVKKYETQKITGRIRAFFLMLRCS